METCEVIIKLKKSSNIVLRNIKAHRAVSVRDIIFLTEKYPNFKAVILDDNTIDLNKLPLTKWTDAGIKTFKISNDEPLENITTVKDLNELQNELYKFLKGIEVRTVGLNAVFKKHEDDLSGGLEEIPTFKKDKNTVSDQDEVLEEITILKKQLKEKENTIKTLKENIRLLKHEEIEYQDTCKHLIIDAVNSFLEIKEKFRLKESEYIELEGKLKKLKQEYQELQEKYKNEIEDTVNKLKSQRIANQELEKKLLTLTTEKDEEIEKLAEQIKEIEEENESLLNNNEFLLKELEKFKKQINELKEENTRLYSESKNGFKEKKRRQEVCADIKLICKYDEKAILIPVFGSGSYGVTTLAVSVAQNLKGKILLMDFDITNPKIDGLIGKNPIIKELSENNNPTASSAFGMLLEKGAGYIIKNDKAVFQKVAKTKDYSLDYFSGVYKPVNILDLMSVNFTQLFRHIGAKYDYIVIDLGRLGASNTVDALIKMVYENAEKSLIVTLKDKFDVRSAAIKCSFLGIKTEDIIWVLNFAENSKIDNAILNNTAGADIVILPKEMGMYGTRELFHKFKLVKDKFYTIIDKYSALTKG